MHKRMLFSGLLLIVTSTVLVAAASNASVLVVDQDIANYWRTTYDILVRPQGLRSPIEEKYGLVEANHLSSIPGGITFEQYKAIRSIPEVEVVAPIAMVGFIPAAALTDSLGELSDPGVYVLKTKVSMRDGINEYYLDTRETYYAIGINADPGANFAGGVFIETNVPDVRGAFIIPVWLAGIEPSQESALINLDKAIITGEYLSDTDSVTPNLDFKVIPTLANATPYVDVTVDAWIERLNLPSPVDSVAQLIHQGGREFLAAMDGNVLSTQKLNSDEAYKQVITKWLALWNGSEAPKGGSNFVMTPPGQIEYSLTEIPFSYNGLTLRIVLPKQDEQGYTPRWTFYRSYQVPTPLRANMVIAAKGVFSIENIPRPLAINRIPLETYYPPAVTLLYDENGNPVKPRRLHPTLNTNGYIQPPPMLLTTLNAARALRGDDAISAIRVRVALEGCPGDYLTCPLTPQNQRKIETIASEIARRTGLDVDIMVGSSPTRVLVHVPGVGYVEEQWIQKNVTLTYKEKVQTGHLLLLGTLLGVGGLFALDLAWAEVAARRRTIALQKALGWRSSTVFRQALGGIAIVGAMAAALGALLTWGVSLLLGWTPPSLSLLTGVPLLVVGLAVIGGLYPAALAARIPPVAGLRRGGIRHGKTPAFFILPSSSLLAFAWQGLARRWSRTALGTLTAALSAALLVLLLAVTIDRQGAMSGTLLGEFILVSIEGYHYAIVAIGFILAALSLGNSLLAGVLERRREIGVLKAVGWRTRAVACLFLLEGALLGALGGLAGALLGLGVFAGLYETLSPRLAWIGLVGVALPVAVGLLAALYPARVAANTPPAEAVRYE